MLKAFKLPEKFKKGAEVSKVRAGLQMGQIEFWGNVGVSQSGGSRYEAEGEDNGRPIPLHVSMALTIAYGTDKQRETLVKSLIVETL